MMIEDTFSISQICGNSPSTSSIEGQALGLGKQQKNPS